MISSDEQYQLIMCQATCKGDPGIEVFQGWDQIEAGTHTNCMLEHPLSARSRSHPRM